MSEAKKTQLSQKRWLIVGGAAVLVVILGWMVLHRRGSLEISYREIRVNRGRIQVTILATGTVQPENRLEIKPPVAGRVEDVLVREGAHVRKGQVLAWMSSTERAALLDAARAQGPEELKRWEADYKPTPILAPIDGTIILRNVESGQTFTNSDSVFVMSDRLTVKAQVDETDISQIKLRQKGRIVLDAYPDQEVPGDVDQIAYDAKTVNNVTTYDVDVLPERTPAFMRSG
ncbi:MAG TPA: efflux RND transporter periplasmic adaptor subunit, partial [Bdellovibrionota bacterium]|nr:efflux RND transporter periplasmic adaptor subunit [Bdellovibrionota bacterium]